MILSAFFTAHFAESCAQFPVNRTISVPFRRVSMEAVSTGPVQNLPPIDARLKRDRFNLYKTTRSWSHSSHRCTHKWHLCGWIERIPGGNPENMTGLETGIMGPAAARLAWSKADQHVPAASSRSSGDAAARALRVQTPQRASTCAQQQHQHHHQHHTNTSTSTTPRLSLQLLVRPTGSAQSTGRAG